MSVLINTSLGDIVVDLWIEECPFTCFNFLSLCKIKYYNNCKIFNIEKNAWFQTGDPPSSNNENVGKGGHSIFHLIEKYKHEKVLKKPLTENIYFNDEINMQRKHDMQGLLCMANKEGKPNTNASQFYVTTTSRHLDYLDGKHTIFGKVEEGMEVIKAIDRLYTEKKNDMEIPIQTVRIRHTQILFDPFEEEESLRKQFEEYLNSVSVLIPPSSPLPIRDDDIIEISKEKLTLEEKPSTEKKRLSKEEYEAKKEREAKSKAIVLEMIGDLPDAEVKPPETVLFVCRLNPITSEKSLRTIFLQYGNIVKCEVVKNGKTGKSKTYAFIEFEDAESCERAFLKSEGLIIDDHKIHVDFSQSIAHLWAQNEMEKKQAETSSPQYETKARNDRYNDNNRRDNRDYNDDYRREHRNSHQSDSYSNRNYRDDYYRDDRRDRRDHRDYRDDYKSERRLDNSDNKRKYNEKDYKSSERRFNDYDQSKKQKR